MHLGMIGLGRMGTNMGLMTAINWALAEADLHLGDRYATDLIRTDPRSRYG